jgi:hypothetical protein
MKSRCPARDGWYEVTKVSPAQIGVPVDYSENAKLTKRLGAIVMNV